jgi:hypothetical protein
MKKSELQQIIREEISKVLNENYEIGDMIQIDPEAFPDFSFPNGTKGQIVDIDKQDYMSDELVYTVKIKYINSQGEVENTLHIEKPNQISEKLKKSIKEELGNYMFFQNLKSIKQMVDELLKLDEKMVDGILASGHDWANDHIATSKDDVEEVHNFLMAQKVVGPVGMDEKKLSPKQKKIASAAPPKDKITGADFKALKK